MRFFIYNLGCKVNGYDAAMMSKLLTDLGLKKTEKPSKADFIIVNSCTVTSKSDSKSKKMLRHFKKENSKAKIILSGCMPQVMSAEEIENLSADFVIGNNNISELSEIVQNIPESKNEVKAHKNDEEFYEDDIKYESEKTRAKLKIQDGCNQFCSYCIIPFARGRARSMPLEKVFQKIDLIDAEGFKELVLVGINLSRYMEDKCESLIKVIDYANGKKNIERIRLGSLEYDNITDEFLMSLSKIEKFCPHFHLSLQSGSDKILKNMNRHYTALDYAKKIEKIRNIFDDPAITTDIIIGFPGETEKDFEETLDFVKKIRFEKVHAFPYSLRKGTKAAKMQQVPDDIKKQRTKELIGVSEEIREEFLKNQIGKKHLVLTEKVSQDSIFGYTKNYIPVKIYGGTMERNQLVEVVITGVKDGFCISENK
ncbi:MAG: tRNA (N(6)-L-threonylcarbamoyladenosine(37)-C(2))-methylthiotransferase MtaB [Clostridia bacterium]|nr:tRNA (N(6)-L-threonylcarbamoyladenosine(37)-C(2))-methylthiotransferase MtaB [Clostridia bacterium]